MKKIFQASIKSLIVAAVATVITTQANAQPGPGGPGSSGSGITYNGVGATPSPQVPFDGGMSLAFAASGIGYAARKLKKKK